MSLDVLSVQSCCQITKLNLEKQTGLKNVGIAGHNLSQIKLPGPVVELELREGGELSAFDFQCIQDLSLKSLKLGVNQITIQDDFK